MFEAKINAHSSVYAVIEGVAISLPSTAKYICQDKRGCWFYCTRRPRIKYNDWTPNKYPIQVINESGYVRVLQTEQSPDWQNTLQTSVKRHHLPQL